MKTTTLAAIAAILMGFTAIPQSFAAGPAPTSTTPVAEVAGVPTLDELLAQIATLQAQLQASTVDPAVNPLVVAEAFILNPVKSLQGNLSADMLIGNQYKPTQMQFTMIPVVEMGQTIWVIDSLLVNGTVIPMPEPIYGLPLGDGGLMRNVFLNLQGLNSAGAYAGSGYIQKDIVLKGESLVVTLIPADLRQEIPVDPSLRGESLMLVIDNFPFGYGWGWYSDGKFYLYLPPVGYPTTYELVNMSTGAVVGSGTIQPFHPAVPANDAYVGIKYLGNVVGAEFPNPAGQESWTQLPDVAFDCLVPLTNGTKVMGKVVFIDVGYGGLQISGAGAFDVYVQKATGIGDMPFVWLDNHSTSDQWGAYTSVNTTGFNIGKVVITIVPKSGNTVVNPWIGLHRFFTAPSGSPIGGNG